MSLDGRYNRVGGLTGLIGCAFLSTLNALDIIDQIKADSEFRDLGLVMAMYLKILGGSFEFGSVHGVHE